MVGYIGLNDKSSGKFGELCDISRIEKEELDVDLLKDMKKDLLRAKENCNFRGLYHSKKWICELLVCLKDIRLDEKCSLDLEDELGDELTTYDMTMSCFALNEFDRAAFFSENGLSPILRFVHLYSRYRSGEKKKNEDSVDPLTSCDQYNSPHLKELHSEFSQSIDESTEDKRLDAWQLYLYGIVLRCLDLQTESMDVLCQSLRLEPSHWGCWMELGQMISGKEVLDKLDLPDHWMRKLFLAHIYVELHRNEEAMDIYSEFDKIGLRNSMYLKAQMAMVSHNQNDIERAIGIFKELEVVDPFRLEYMDIYSNMLYVKGMRVELSHLAHRVTLINKYSVETCCVTGNYYSLRGQHEKSVQYFQRALRLDPLYLAGWTLMGHEYMEMKNTNAAIQCYRQAIEVNRRDYRAWYGLGQTYEVLKLPAYCIYYYKQAQWLHPNDSRTLIALGDSYEKLDKFEEAKKCYHKAHSVGDIEDLALIRLARLYSQLGETERSKVLYEKFLLETEDNCGGDDKATERGQAYHFLAEHHLNKGLIDLAYDYAHKCTLFAETREAGKTMLREIASKRQHVDGKIENCGILSSVMNPLSFGLDEDDSDRPFSNNFTPQNLNFSP